MASDLNVGLSTGAWMEKDYSRMSLALPIVTHFDNSTPSMSAKCQLSKVDCNTINLKMCKPNNACKQSP